MDVNVRIEITHALRHRGVDVLTAQEDGAAELPDAELLNRSTALGRVLFTHDRDLLTESAVRQAESRTFAGVIYARQLGVTIGACVNDLELIAKACEPEEILNEVRYVPLR